MIRAWGQVVYYGKWSQDAQAVTGGNQLGKVGKQREHSWGHCRTLAEELRRHDLNYLSKGGEAGALSTDACFTGWALNAQCFWVFPVCSAPTRTGAGESPQIEKQRAVGTWGRKLSDAEDCLLHLQVEMCSRNGMYLSTIFSTFLPWIKHYVSLHLHYPAQSLCKCASLISCILPNVRDCVLFVSCLHFQGLGVAQGKGKSEGTVSNAMA